MLDSDLRSPWHTGHSCAEYPKSNRDQWVAFDFGLEGANLSGVRVTAPSKKEWDGAEMKTFRVEKADEIEGPWETVFAGVAKKTKSPQPFYFSASTRYLRLFVVDNHGHGCITVGNVEFRGELLSDGAAQFAAPSIGMDTPRGGRRDKGARALRPARRRRPPSLLQNCRAEVARSDKELLERRPGRRGEVASRAAAANDGVRARARRVDRRRARPRLRAPAAAGAAGAGTAPRARRRGRGATATARPRRARRPRRPRSTACLRRARAASGGSRKTTRRRAARAPAAPAGLSAAPRRPRRPRRGRRRPPTRPRPPRRPRARGRRDRRGAAAAAPARRAARFRPRRRARTSRSGPASPTPSTATVPALGTAPATAARPRRRPRPPPPPADAAAPAAADDAAADDAATGRADAVALAAAPTRPRPPRARRGGRRARGQTATEVKVMRRGRGTTPSRLGDQGCPPAFDASRRRLLPATRPAFFNVDATVRMQGEINKLTADNRDKLAKVPRRRAGRDAAATADGAQPPSSRPRASPSASSTPAATRSASCAATFDEHRRASELLTPSRPRSARTTRCPRRPPRPPTAGGAPSPRAAAPPAAAARARRRGRRAAAARAATLSKDFNKLLNEIGAVPSADRGGAGRGRAPRDDPECAPAHEA